VKADSAKLCVFFVELFANTLPSAKPSLGKKKLEGKKSNLTAAATTPARALTAQTVPARACFGSANQVYFIFLFF
jgi:hypothetical protein